MAPSITALNITENYASLTVLTQTQLNTAMSSIETYAGTYLANNIVQLALDMYGSSGTLDNDGAANLATPLVSAAAFLAENETITGNWTFSGTLTLNNTVTSTSTFTSSGQHRAKAYLTTANQSLTNATATAISLGAESYDIGTMHDNSTNPSRITIPSGGAGIYNIVAQVTFDNNATGRRKVSIYKNGSEIATVENFYPDATVDLVLQCCAHDVGSVNDYYEVYARQDSGGALDAVLGEYQTFISVMKVW